MENLLFFFYFFSHKLRKIIRKSFLLAETNFEIQQGYTLVCDIVDEVTNSLANAYPELVKNNEKVNCCNIV